MSDPLPDLDRDTIVALAGYSTIGSPQLAADTIHHAATDAAKRITERIDADEA